MGWAMTRVIEFSGSGSRIQLFQFGGLTPVQPGYQCHWFAAVVQEVNVPMLGNAGWANSNPKASCQLGRMASWRRVQFRFFSLLLCVVLSSLSWAAEAEIGYHEYRFEKHDTGVPWSEIRFKRQAENQLAPSVNKTNKLQDTSLLDNSSQTKVSKITYVPPNQTNSTDAGTQPLNNSSVTTAKPVTSNDEDEKVEEPEVDYNGRNVSLETTPSYDHHRYYNSTFYTESAKAQELWMDFNTLNSSDVITHDMLSQSHRRAATLKLSFNFPFYGHLVRNVTIATGGFLYLGDYMHSWLAATQYIAPLMANFDTSLSNDSTIKYVDNGTAFVVQWERVVLQDRKDAGNFTFQAILHKSGDIVFVYQEIPLLVSTIRDEAHPVKVGISDAYIIDRTIFFVRRKTIYEYHKVDLKRDEIKNWTAIYFQALPTCLVFENCESCLNHTINFECTWCPSARRCSDGMDRSRQDWLIKNCDKSVVEDVAACSVIPNSTLPPGVVFNTNPATVQAAKNAPEDLFPSPSHEIQEDVNIPKAIEVVVSTTTMGETTTNAPLVTKQENNPQPTPSFTTMHYSGFYDRLSEPAGKIEEPSGGMSVSGVIGILVFTALLVACIVWVFYAYRNPQTPSGQCLIKYRPGNWSWRRGEVHYTAAAIHM